MRQAEILSFVKAKTVCRTDAFPVRGSEALVPLVAVRPAFGPEGRRASSASGGRLMLLAACLLLLFSLIPVGFLVSRAFDASQAACVYESVAIESGDTLWDLADTYMDPDRTSRSAFMDELRTLNHLSTDTLREGSFLIVPIYQ